jgi:hypothetical protein
MLQDSNGKLSTSRTFLAGLMAGATEAVLAVTPMETVCMAKVTPYCDLVCIASRDVFHLRTCLAISTS